MIKICECGCGKEFEVNKRWKYRGNSQRFISGHNLNLEETKEKNRLAMQTPEHKAKVSELGKMQYNNGRYMPSRKGLRSPMKDKHLTQEQKDHLRDINLGKHHSNDTREKCRKIAQKNGYGLWMAGKKSSKKTRMKISDALAGKTPANNMTAGKYGNIQRGWFLIGKEKMFFRSKWEANYALYLNFLIKQKQIKKWEYEKDVFMFEKIKLGTRSYKPDFKVFNNDDTIEYHEVKGYMDSKSLTKLKRMRIYYPDVKLILIEKTAYKSIKDKLGSILHFF